MACQLNPNTYSLMFRFPLEENAPEKLRFGHLRRRRTRRARQGARAKLKTPARARAGQTLSKYVADMVSKHVGDRELTEDERKWFDEHLEMNKARRARADRMSAAGYFKRRKRGRPRKPGPRKGWKKNGKIREEKA